MSNKIFKSDTDWFSAPDVETATRLRNELYGWSPTGEEAQGDEFDPAPLPGDKMLRVGFESDLDVPTWTNGFDSHATITKGDSQSPTFVDAPCRIWAKHTTGMVASTEW